jgi:hypothetical protein
MSQTFHATARKALDSVTGEVTPDVIAAMLSMLATLFGTRHTSTGKPGGASKGNMPPRRAGWLWTTDATDNHAARILHAAGLVWIGEGPDADTLTVGRWFGLAFNADAGPSVTAPCLREDVDAADAVERDVRQYERSNRPGADKGAEVDAESPEAVRARHEALTKRLADGGGF